jgi:hypothetical protein
MSDPMTMDEMTCGKGLALHAELPTRFAELLMALADNLELHLPTLDMVDPSAQREHAAYLHLATQYRDIGRRLQTTAREMDEYRDLPMGRHYEGALLGSQMINAFEDFVDIERELRSCLRQAVERDELRLGQMRAARGD